MKNCTSHCSSDKAGINMERKQHISLIKGETDARPCHIHISVCLCMDLDNMGREKVFTTEGF